MSVVVRRESHEAQKASLSRQITSGVTSALLPDRAEGAVACITCVKGDLLGLPE